MELYANKILPEDVFLTTLEFEEQKGITLSEPKKLVHKNRPSGNEFIDKLAELMSVYKMEACCFYEKKMEIEAGKLQELLSLYSGMTFMEWRNQYLQLAAKELLLQTNYEIAEIAKRLGYAGIHTFSRWFVQLGNIMPSDWRRFAKRKQEHENKKLSLKDNAKNLNR